MWLNRGKTAYFLLKKYLKDVKNELHYTIPPFFFKAIACLSSVLLLCFSLNSPLVICQIHMRVYKRTGHFVSFFASNYNQVSKHTFDKTERYVTIRANCKEIPTKDIHAALKQFLTC